jgi:hypothetical protein
MGGSDAMSAAFRAVFMIFRASGPSWEQSVLRMLQQAAEGQDEWQPFDAPCLG